MNLFYLYFQDLPRVPHNKFAADFQQGARYSRLQEVCHRVRNPGAQSNNIPNELFRRLLFQAARKALCSSGTPITLLSDMFDVLTLESCEELFKTVEQEVISC